MKKFKAIMFIDSLGSGGAQRQLVEIAKYFVKQNIIVTFLVYHDLNFFEHEIQESKILIKKILDKNYITRTLKIRKYIIKEKPDFIISFMSGPVFISEFTSLTSKKNWFLAVGERSANPNMMKGLKWKFLRNFHMFADHVVTNSLKNKEMILSSGSLLNEKKISTIYNSLDLNFWKPLEDFKFLRNSKLNLVIVATHHYNKNLNNLVEAVKKLPQKHKKNLYINWYGKIWDNSFYEAQNKIKKYGLEEIFTFHKPKKKILKVIQKADAIGLFSFYEGLSNAICEGMACAKPIIASNVSDNGILLNSTKELLSDPNDPEEIFSSLCYLLEKTANDLENLGKINREFSKIHFDTEKNSAKYLSILLNEKNKINLHR